MRARHGDCNVSGMTLLQSTPSSRRAKSSAGPTRCRRKFLRIFPDGFRDETYLAWERDYKANAHAQFEEQLSQGHMRSLIRAGEFVEAANRAARIESRTNL